MRTLKKVLALSLVFAMAFTLMAGAAYKDEDSINSSLRDDITLLEALGVFQGDENGNFNPEKNVTRAEAAKMIYVLKNNGVDDGAVAFQGVSKYSDVTTGFWAEGYINYCTNLGIMAGWSENGVQKFDPNGNVTGVELTKMLLCLVGYRADVQGYTNNNAWQANVLLDGANSGITTTYEPSVYSPAPRQWTARLLVNALNAPFVTYNRGEIMYGTMNDPNRSYAEQYLGLDTVVGVLTATNSNKLGTDLKSIESSLNDSEYSRIMTGVDSNGQPVNRSFKVDVDDALLGRQVKVYYKNDNKVNEEDNKVYAVLPYDKDIKVVETTVDAVDYDSNNAKKVTVDGLGTKTYSNQKIDVYMNNVLYAEDRTIDQLKEFLDVNSNLPVTLVADNDGYINTVLIHELSGYAIVDKHDADKNTLSFDKLSTYVGKNLVDEKGDKLTFNNTSDNKDNYSKYLNVIDTVEDGDVVKITANTTSGELVYDITLAETVSGTPSGYTLDKSGANIDKLTVNGNEYKKAVGAMAIDGYTWSKDDSVTTDTTFYTDGKYVIYSEGGSGSVSVSNLAYLIGWRQTEKYGEKTTYAKVLLSDGTIGEYEVDATYSIVTGDTNKLVKDKSINEKLLGNQAGSNTVLAYSLSGDKIILKELLGDDDTKFATGKTEFKDSSNTVVVGNEEYRVNDDTYFFVKTQEEGKKAEYEVVKASELSRDQTSQAASTSYATKTVNNIPTFMFGVLDLNEAIKAKGADYVFAANSARVESAENDEWNAVITVLDENGEEVTLTKSHSDQASAQTTANDWNALKGQVVTYTTNADGEVDDFEAVENAQSTDKLDNDKWNQVTVIGWSDGSAYVQLADGTTLKNVKYADDVKMFGIDCSEDPAQWDGVASDVEEAVKGEDGKYTVNAYAYVELDGTTQVITDIFFDVNGGNAAGLWS